MATPRAAARRHAVLASALFLFLAAAPAAAQDEELECYKVRSGSRFAATLDVANQRPELNVDPGCRLVGKARFLCSPASAALLSHENLPGGPLAVPGQSLTGARLCYRVRCKRSEPILPRVFRDRFGFHEISGYQAKLLCTSAEDAVATTTTTLPPATTTTLPPPEDPQLLTLSGLSYAGAFRLPASTYGNSSLNYSEGPFVYAPDTNSIFIVGHTYEQAIAEFTVPPLVNSTVLADLNMAGAPVQVFASVLGRAPDTDAANMMNRIGGLALRGGAGSRSLVVNAYEYYDAPGDNWLTTIVLADVDDLAGSAVDGFVSFAGGAGHTSGWISEVPAEWQGSLGGSHVTGQSSGIPILSRTSVGPSAFAFDPADLDGAGPAPGSVATGKLLDYSLANPLHADLSNSSLTNQLWTHLSRATFGFVVPGMRTYFVVGSSGGHASGVGYKITQDNGNLCGGYCPYEAADVSAYYWAFDLDDLAAVRAGTTVAHDVRPYAYGPFPAPFGATDIGGGSFDVATSTLYLTLQRADRDQGTYSNPPVVVAYSVATP